MVLICGDPFEAVTAFVCSELKTLRIEHRVLDLRVSANESAPNWFWSGGRIPGSISTADWQVDLDDLSGVYFRDALSGELGSAGQYSERVPSTYPRTEPRLAALINCLPCRVVNRPAATFSNRSKPYQAAIICQFGFKIPQTLITNDPDAARSFYHECSGNVIFKSISGVRSTVQRMTDKDLERLALLAHGPTQFQEYLSGDNIRVHVIGERLFAVRIKCDAIDYRYAGQEGCVRTMLTEKVPSEVENGCIRLTRAFGLAMSGIDLKETPAGDYYCFEVNTSPAFPFYEPPGRPVVANALAEFLAQRNG
jgi:hypothetical protein